MRPTPTYLDKFHDAQWQARADLRVIADVADVLDRFGSPLAEQLWRAIDSLEQAHNQMSEAVSEDLTRQVKTAHGHIAEVFLAAMTVLGKEGEQVQ